jgi:hypothetical protein
MLQPKSLVQCLFGCWWINLMISVSYDAFPSVFCCGLVTYILYSGYIRVDDRTCEPVQARPTRDEIDVVEALGILYSSNA